MMLRLKTTLTKHHYHTKTIVSLSLRNFALFGPRSTQTSGDQQRQQIDFATMEPQQQQQRSQEEIIRSIQTYRTNIKQKTAQGHALSQSIANSVEQNKHVKLQRYEIFIDKMERLYKSEVRFQKKQQKKFDLQKNAILYSLTPLKDILRAYSDLTTRGFNSEATVQTLQTIVSVLRARGFRGRVQGDYTQAEMDQSWRMQRLVDDLKFALEKDQFISPHHLAMMNLGLGDIGYKNTSLIPLMFDKIETLLNERQLGKHFEAKEQSFLDAVYGGPKGFVERHYVFKGFENSEEFNEYLQILMEWEKDATEIQETEAAVPSRQELNEQASDIQRSMQDVINAAVQVKEFQKEHQANIDNLRQQFFLMSEAADKHAFLQENQYIKYDLLELQELLVKGGFVEPDEATAILSNEPFDQRMSRAADVFYDYVVNYAPELISPQYNAFYEAATNIQPTKDHKASNINYVEETQNQITLKSLSQALVGLAEQALSYRRDVLKEDYLNKFYEDYVMPLEIKEHIANVPELKKLEVEIIQMESAYLRGWQQYKQNSERVNSRLASLVSEDKKSLEGQLNALEALNALRIDEQQLRQEIVNNSLALISSREVSADQSSIVSGLNGLANAPSIDDKARQLGHKLAARLDASALSFPEQLKALWSLCALQLYDTYVIEELLKKLNMTTFERLDNELKYQEFVKILDISNALKLEGPRHLQITNQGLLDGINGQNFQLLRYLEHTSNYDPFKKRVVQALSKGLTNASIEHQIIMENELYQAQTLDQDVLNRDRFPYKPDLIMGYKGHKVGVFVVPETQAMRDTHRPDGTHRFRMRLLERANQPQNIKLAAIAVDDVVKYDIEKLKCEVNHNFKFLETLESQISITGVKEPDFSGFSNFGARMINQAAEYIEGLDSQREAQKMDTLIQRLYQVLHIKQVNALRFEQHQKAQGYDDLRFQLMKLSLLYDSLSQQSKSFVDKFALPISTDFKSLLSNTISTIPKPRQQSDQRDSGIDFSWLGTRQEVELPLNKEATSTIKKSIVPEMINQRFMWVDDYFHYDDWKTKQQQVYDNFNLLIVPPHSDAPKYFFDRNHHHRRIPEGVFPYPTHKRQLLLPTANNPVTDLLKSQSQHNDDYVLFEKEPYKMMVVQELKKSEQLLPIDEDTSMITNLQNIKQGLKSDYSDREILNIVLGNLSFTEQLIEEHLNIRKSEGKQEVKYVPRDPQKFRRFVESTYFTKDREDPYTHFFLKEAKNKEYINRQMEEEKQRMTLEEDQSKDTDLLKEGEERRMAFQEKVENMLMQEDMVNNDLIDLSSPLKNKVEVKYDLKTLVKSEFVYDIDPEVTDEQLSHEEYLDIHRRRAEAKLIKMKIIYKLYNNENGEGEQQLTENEKKYLKAWTYDIKTNRHLLNLRDSMVPKESSKLTIGDVEAKGLYALNSISRVSIERDRHSQYALSDLVVELSHFLDEEVVNKIETEIFSDKLRSEWGLSNDFKVIETRNKEISLVLNELEELAWRSAGMLNEKDLEHLKAMISVKRNKDHFDKQFYENDMASFRHFAESVNIYDDRLSLLERWLVRKEDEIKQRVVRPPANLKKPDHELHDLVDKPLKVARQRLVSKLLVSDEYGNPIDKEYKDLTSRELHTLTENLCLRMYMFNYDYPAFLPQVVRALLEHPNLQKSDMDQMELYSKMFELDWKGDSSYKNKQEFMSTNPIYFSDGTNIKSYGEITNDTVKDMLQKACAPYVEETAKTLLKYSQQ